MKMAVGINGLFVVGFSYNHTKDRTLTGSIVSFFISVIVYELLLWSDI
jgi:hypothetical protein